MTLQDLVNENIPEVLWHYTSISTFKNIVDGGKKIECQKPVEPVLWATDTRFLNDKEEATHAIQIAHEKAREISDENERKLLLRILEQNCDAGILSPSESRMFVVSFSEEKDLLSQWRAYAAAPTGLSLGFDLRAMRSNTSPARDVWADFARCIYDRQKKEQIICGAINNFLLSGKQQLIADISQRAGSLISQLATLIPLLKHESFKEEKEWRLVIRRFEKHKNTSTERMFRLGGSGLIPYLNWPIALKTPEPEADMRALLTHVVVGPHPDIDLTKETVESWLSQEGIPAIVEKSNTPFRSW